MGFLETAPARRSQVLREQGLAMASWMSRLQTGDIDEETHKKERKEACDSLKLITLSSPCWRG